MNRRDVMLWGVAVMLWGVAVMTAAGGCDRGCASKGGRAGGDIKKGRRTPAAKTPKNAKTTLVVQIATEPPSLVPMIHPDIWSHRITVHNILESLVAFDPKSPHALRGELARVWRVSPDGKTYDFTLRRDVRWHDGKPFGAKDVVFTFDRVLDSKVRAVSTRSSIQSFIGHYEAVGKHGFRIVCTRRSPFFLKALTDVTILPSHRMKDADLNTHPLLRAPIGTGPYRFASWRSGQEIVVDRNEHYWGRPASIGRIIYRVIRNPELALQMARRHELDLVPRFHGVQWVKRVLVDKSLLAAYRPVVHVTPGTAFVLLNHKRSIFSDVRVRRALARLLDVRTIVDKIMYGQATRIASLYWVDDPEHDASIKPIPFDPSVAEKLLDAAGWHDHDGDGIRDRGPGEVLRFTFSLVASSKSTRRWATIYQQALRKAGIAMSIVPIEWTAYLAKIRRHDFDMGTLGMALAGPYTDLYVQFHSSQIADGQNYAAYANKEVDKLLEAIRQELDDAKRRGLSFKLQRLLAADVPVIPLFTLKDPGLVSRRVSGVYRSPLWYQIRDWSIRDTPGGRQ